MDDLPEPSHLRILRRTVMVLTTVMIVGVVVVIGLLVTRLTRDDPVFPEAIVLPEGAKAVAFT
jgi:hypothetical protein